ncbi:hypothetical protein ZWY2020_016423 [Hordeum vulgare]|nr:hypothetical protein ZWY2020_016423 [Hordeum vulgare]
MEPEASKEAEKQPMEAEAGDLADPRDLANFINPLPFSCLSSDDEIDYSVEPEFYDPAVDDVDECWGHKQRKGRTSDAVLSCRRVSLPCAWIPRDHPCSYLSCRLVSSIRRRNSSTTTKRHHLSSRLVSSIRRRNSSTTTKRHHLSSRLVSSIRRRNSSTTTKRHHLSSRLVSSIRRRNSSTTTKRHHLSSRLVSSIRRRNSSTTTKRHHLSSRLVSSIRRRNSSTTTKRHHLSSRLVSSIRRRNSSTTTKRHHLSSRLVSSIRRRNSSTTTKRHHLSSRLVSSIRRRNSSTTTKRHHLSRLVSSITRRNSSTTTKRHHLSSRLVSSITRRNSSTTTKRHHLSSRHLDHSILLAQRNSVHSDLAMATKLTAIAFFLFVLALGESNDKEVNGFGESAYAVHWDKDSPPSPLVPMVAAPPLPSSPKAPAKRQQIKFQTGMLFLKKNLHVGTILPEGTMFARADAPKSVNFVSTPLESKYLTTILSHFMIPRGSTKAKQVADTLRSCGKPVDKEEPHMCFSSREAMSRFATKEIGVSSARAAITRIHGNETPNSMYVVEQITQLNNNVVPCHPMDFPYEVFYCHRPKEVQSLRVQLKGLKDGMPHVTAIAMCHMNTSDWDTQYFELLDGKHGEPICHYMPTNYIMFY